jgi:hypothetical protein
MKLSTKAALYSGLVFPGTGYFFIANKKKAWGCIALSLLCFASLMSEAIFKANIIAQKIIYGEIPYHIKTIREQILLVEGKFSESTLTGIMLIFIAVWIFSTIDGYIQARKVGNEL